MILVEARRPITNKALGLGKVKLTAAFTVFSVASSNAISYLVSATFFPDIAYGAAWYMTATVIPLAVAPISFWVILSLLCEIEDKNRQLRSLMHFDHLTATYNRRHFDEEVRTRARAYTAGEACFSLIIFDVDFFKRINDTYGHAGGDAALVEIARRAKQNVRRGDIVTRFGGEEFVIFLPGAPLDVTTAVAERVRKAICGEPIRFGGQDISVSISLGISTSTEGAATADIEDLLKLADSRLYMAKERGRNRVIAANAS